MTRLCPDCHTERALTETRCENIIDDHLCGKDLTLEPLSDQADFIPTLRPVNHSPVKAIDDWQIVKRINNSDSIRERYQVQHKISGQQGILTLYTNGAEPDLTIYDVIKTLPREHVPEIIAIGRWNDRAWQVAEELTGGSLADSARDGDFWQPDEIDHIVREMGTALSCFSEHGLRHRDLRPSNVLIRTRHPLDIVIIEFGSARLSELDLDIVSPLEITRYSAPETLTGSVAAASDWWSFGIILLEQLTQGRCFSHFKTNDFLVNILANGITIPDSFAPRLRQLLRGLLTRDRYQRWQWPEVEAWLDGRSVRVVDNITQQAEPAHSGIELNHQIYSHPARFALAAAEQVNWERARSLLQQGAIYLWAEEIGLSPQRIAILHHLNGLTDLNPNDGLMLALKVLNPNMPLIYRGEIVTPAWLLTHPQEGYQLIHGPVPDLLGQAEPGNWLTQVKAREQRLRQRGQSLGVEFDEEILRVHLLSTSKARLLAIWEKQRRLFPDTEHQGLKTLIDRRNLSEEELILLLSAAVSQFISAESLLFRAKLLAEQYDILTFDRDASRQLLRQPRQDIYRQVAERIDGFSRCNIPDIDQWAEYFLLTRRLPLVQTLVLLSLPEEHWLEPEKQRYINQVLDFFTRKITANTLRGPLVRMSIGKRSGRVDLHELGGQKKSAEALLNHLLARGRQSITVDTQTLLENEQATDRLRILNNQTQLYKRDTGIDGLYLGFPFLLINTQPGQIKTRIAPLLLWPVKINMNAGIRAVASLSFDDERGAVRLNPALENFNGIGNISAWNDAAEDLLNRVTLTAEEVIERFAPLISTVTAQMDKLPELNVEIPDNSVQLVNSAVMFHVSFIGQAISEDLRQLRNLSPAGTSLETALKLATVPQSQPVILDSADCYFTAASDPSQEAAVAEARNAPGLLIEGPPGTGKSQTIVNMVADAIGQRRSLLVICQKPAALEVVYKRIIADGLGDRIVMVSDAQKGRDIIRNIRTQLEGLFQRPKFDADNLRQQTASQIDLLGKNLDEYHRAMHQADSPEGISYHSLLSELIALESHPKLLDVPALRTILANCSLNQLEIIKSELLPVISLWLAADYEQSPLSQLSPFLSGQSVLNDFSQRFNQFYAAETERNKTLENPNRAFDIDDAELRQHWLTQNSAVFNQLEAKQWQNLTRWLPLFYSTTGDNRQGEQVLARLGQLATRLRDIDTTGSDPLLFGPLTTCNNALLSQLIHAAAAETEHLSALRYLNPLYYVRRAKLNAFLITTGRQSNHDSLTRLLISARLEQQWRMARTELSRLYQQLALPAVDLLDGIGLAMQVNTSQRELQQTEALFHRLAQSPDAQRLISAIVEHQQIGFNQQSDEINAAIQRKHGRDRSQRALTNLQGWLQDSATQVFSRAITEHISLAARLNELSQAMPTLAAYQQFRPYAAQMESSSLDILSILREQAAGLKAFNEQDLESLIARTLDREARLIWKQRAEWSAPQLQQQPADIDRQVGMLAIADEKMRDLNRQKLTQDFDLDAIQLPHHWEEITRLTGKRARRLREFIEEGEKLGLMSLRPIWLMTPDIASQVLPLKPGLFDTVIYDEASQMPIEYALPTLFRGRHMIVSGDEKQMPPSVFFSGRVLAEDDIDDENADLDDEQTPDTDEIWNYQEISECPDLLHLARTVLPARTLEIHYRSAYRELINFSNHAFYENRLNIPAQHSDKVIRSIAPVSLLPVNGLYQNQSNHQEALRVVELLEQIWQQPINQRPSVGVVTFNQKQALLIQDELERKSCDSPSFRVAHMDELQRMEEGEDMSFFVKNVENVQGDERDIIIFSTTFGRNSQGTFRRNFGILGQSGGERRLNVAVTRARKQVTILTSMPIEEISDLINTHHQPSTPRDFLQGYLEYARALSAGEFSYGRALLSRLTRTESAHRQIAISHNGFIQSVTEYLGIQGWQLAEPQQVGAFYFDCIIEDPQTGQYLLGIECDTPRHPLLQRARARELWRPGVLKRVTPYRHRISIFHWYSDAEQERARLKLAIEQATTHLAK